MKSILSIGVICVLSYSLVTVGSQGNTSCLSGSTGLDWYTDSVGETPCQTYQRLRQICNSAYTVGSLPTTSVPDVCADQVSGCCCNSISYALLMLCLNCQQGAGQDSVINAQPGLYGLYLDNCGPVYDQILPWDIQSAVCNDKMKIFDDLYNILFTEGAWLYTFTKETIQKDQRAYANNTFTHCASTTIDNSTNTASSSSTTASSSASDATGSAATKLMDQLSTTNNSLSGSAIGGVVGGVLVALSVVGMIGWFFRRRRSADYSYNAVDPENDPTVEPFTPNIGYTAATAVTASYHDVSSIESTESQYDPITPAPSLRLAQPPFSRFEKHGLPSDNYNNTSLVHPTLSTSQITPTAVAQVSSSSTTSDVFSKRHADGGPLLARSASGRLPPAYGEQL